jgi:thiol:disulfide interchange protein DsbC
MAPANFRRSLFTHLAIPAACLLLGVNQPVFAKDDAYSAVEEKIRGLAPNATTIAVSETPIEGLLQVQVNSEIIYATSDAKFLLQGNIIDIDTRDNITDQAKSGIRKGLLKGLDSSQQISFEPEKTVHNLLVFTDIDCGYCRKLHNQIDEYMEEGIAIHYLAFPRAGVGSHSYDKAVSVWCADDPNEAMTQAKNNVDPDPLQCTNPVAEQYQLGMQIGVTGTPALVTEDGTLIPGYMPPNQLRARLDAMDMVQLAD